VKNYRNTRTGVKVWTSFVWSSGLSWRWLPWNWATFDQM